MRNFLKRELFIVILLLAVSLLFLPGAAEEPPMQETEQVADGDCVQIELPQAVEIPVEEQIIKAEEPEANEDTEDTVDVNVILRPVNLKVERLSRVTLKLSWNGREGVDYYEVYRSEDAGNGFKLIKTLEGRAMRDTGLESMRTYYYVVVPVAGGVRGEDSDIASARTSLDEVTGLAAAGIDYNSIKLTWNRVGGANKYKIYRSTQKDGDYSAIKLVGNKNTYTDTGLKLGTKYYYKIAPCLDGATCDTGGEVVATPRLETVGGASLNRLSADSIRLKWRHVKGAKSYVVYRADLRGGEYRRLGEVKRESGPYFVDKKLEEGKTYYYRIAAIRGGTEGQKSAIVKSPNMSATVSGVKVNNVNEYGDMLVSWNALKGANIDGYKVSFSIDPNEFTSEAGWATDWVTGDYKIVDANVTSYTFTGMEPGRKLSFEVTPVWKDAYRGVAYGKCEAAVTAKAVVKASVQRFIDVLRSQVGKPYVWGGRGPTVYDCSGLLYYALNKSGVSVRYVTSHTWYRSNYQTIRNMNDWRPGDVMVMPGHVAMYVGGGMVIDASSDNGCVIYRRPWIPSDRDWYAKRIFA